MEGGASVSLRYELTQGVPYLSYHCLSHYLPCPRHGQVSSPAPVSRSLRSTLPDERAMRTISSHSAGTEQFLFELVFERDSDQTIMHFSHKFLGTKTSVEFVNGRNLLNRFIIAAIFNINSDMS